MRARKNERATTKRATRATASPARWKTRLAAVWIVLPLAVLGAVGWGIWSWRTSQQYVQQFELAAIEVNGLRLLSGDDVLDASGLAIGDNVLDIDLRAVSERLEREPWIKRAIVVRKPPDRLVVELVERQRLAWLKLGQTYGVDEEGILLPARRLANESLSEVDLPVITGVSVELDSLYPGMALADSAGVLSAVLAWWKRAIEVDPEFCMGISDLEALQDDGIGLRLAGDGLEVRLPFDRVDERLRELKRMMPRIYREYPNPAYIDLRYARQLVVGGKEKGAG